MINRESISEFCRDLYVYSANKIWLQLKLDIQLLRMSQLSWIPLLMKSPLNSALLVLLLSPNSTSRCTSKTAINILQSIATLTVSCLGLRQPSARNKASTTCCHNDGSTAERTALAPSIDKRTFFRDFSPCHSHGFKYSFFCVHFVFVFVFWKAAQ